MGRIVLLVVVTLFALSGLMRFGLVPGPIVPFAQYILWVGWSLACPLFFLSILVAPGLYRDTTDSISRFWQRVRTRRVEVEQLQRKIAHLDRPHHMVQLGTIFAKQGRTAKAVHWFQKALEKDPDLIDAQHKLALCYFDQAHFEPAVELLEKVHAKKPDYDYGVAYLRLAEAHHQLGNVERAAEIYEMLLRFYPGQPEGSFHYAQLLAGDNKHEEAARYMQEVVFTLRHSPAFQRRRNRHWMLKARWWLWRHRR